MKFEIKIVEREKYLKTTYLRDVPYEDIEGKYYEYRKPDNNLNITLHNRVFVVDVDGVPFDIPVIKLLDLF